MKTCKKCVSIMISPQGIAVRFYVEIDGIKYYSAYTNSVGDIFRGCCASCETLMNAVK